MHLEPKIWNSLYSDLKSTNTINSIKHKIKDNFLSKINRERGKRSIRVLLKLRDLSHTYDSALLNYALSKST